MRLRFAFVPALLLALPAAVAPAQGSGIYTCLELPVSAHAAALGGRVVSVVEPELSLAEQNPALLCPEMSGQLSLGYMNYVSDINLAYAGWGGRLAAEGGWTASVRYLGYGDFDGRDEWGGSTGTFTAGDLAVSAGVGYALADRWRIGAIARALYSKYESYTGLALAVDVGVNYYSDVAGRSLALVVTGLGGQVKRLADRRQPVRADAVLGWSKEVEHLPLCLTLTAYGLLHWDDEYVRGDGTLGSYHGADQLLTHLNLGAEWIATDRLWFGLGYNYRRQREFSGAGGFLRGLSAGGGLTYGALQIQLAYARYNAADGSLSLGLQWQF